MTDNKSNKRQDRLLRLVHRSNHQHLPFFDVGPYLPLGIQVELVERGGWLMNPHVINEFAHKVIRKKEELVIFNCLLRYTLGFNRPTCQVSYTFVSKWTGLNVPNTRRGIKGLIQSKLIVIARFGTAAQTTVYEIPIVTGFLLWAAEKQNKKERSAASSTSREESTPMGGSLMDNSLMEERSNGLLSNGVQDPSQADYRPIVTPTIKKQNSETNETHSHQQHPDGSVLEQYFESVQPRGKQNQEREFFKRLKMDFREADIVLGLQYLRTHGVLGSREPCHSPMKYLSVAGAQVIALAKTEVDSQRRRVQTERESTDRERTERQKLESEERHHQEALDAFVREFPQPEDQNTHIADFVKAKFPEKEQSVSQFIPRSALLGMTARRWYEQELKRPTSGG